MVVSSADDLVEHLVALLVMKMAAYSDAAMADKMVGRWVDCLAQRSAVSTVA